MAKYEEVKEVSQGHFRRLTGLKRETFEKMVSILLETQNKRYRKAGRRGKLSIEDKLLMALEYLREYRTYFHLGRSYGLSESACYRACRWVEDTLIKSGEFSLCLVLKKVYRLDYNPDINLQIKLNPGPRLQGLIFLDNSFSIIF